ARRKRAMFCIFTHPLESIIEPTTCSHPAVFISRGLHFTRGLARRNQQTNLVRNALSAWFDSPLLSSESADSKWVCPTESRHFSRPRQVPGCDLSTASPNYWNPARS